MNYEELFFDCCLGCGEVKHSGMGIFYQLTHPCNTNREVYSTSYSRRWFIMKLNGIMGGSDGLECLKLTNYKLFPHLQRMVPIINFEAAIIDVSDEGWVYKASIENEHPLDRMLYAYGREYDRKVLPIISQFIQREKLFDRKF